jgi:hypothetical protein
MGGEGINLEETREESMHTIIETKQFHCLVAYKLRPR